MDYLEIKKKLLNAFETKLANFEQADELVSKIELIGDQYNLTLGEVGEIFDLIDKIIRGEVSLDNFLESLLQRLEVTEEETRDIAELLEKEIFKPLEVRGVIKQTRADSEIKGLEKKLAMVNKELAKRKSKV